MAEKLPHNPEIAKKVREHVRNGVPIRTIIADIQGYQNAPQSYATFKRIYGQDVERAKAAVISEVGSRVVNQALHGDPKEASTFKSQEFFLRSKGDWSPKESVEAREVGPDEEETESAVDALMKALGKDSNEE